MAKFKIEFKATVKTEVGVDTRQFKRIADENELADLVRTYASEQGLELFTIRKIVERPPKVEAKKPEVKK